MMMVKLARPPEISQNPPSHGDETMITRRAARKLTIGSLEALDERIVPAGGVGLTATAAQVAALDARGGQVLSSIYHQFASYEQAGAKGAFTTSASRVVPIDGTSVEVDVRFGAGDFNTLVGQLKGAGMRVTSVSSQLRVVEGFLSIANLPTVAANSHVTSLSPSFKPVLGRVSAEAFTPPSAAQQQATVVAKGGQVLGSIYQQFASYQQAGAKGAFTPTLARQVYINGTSIKVDIRFGAGDFNTLVSQLKGAGMQVTSVSPQLRVVEGFLSIANLPTVAANSHVTSLSPSFRPVLG